VNGNQLSVSDLNARRRQAVLLRLQGEKLAVVTGSTGLSAPTVIAATKAYRQGGWSAVDVSPRRGRPATGQAGIPPEFAHELMEDVRGGMPEDAGLPGSALWSRQAIGQWLAAKGVERGAGAIARLCEQFGFEDPAQDPAAAQRDDDVLRLHARERYLAAADAASGSTGLLSVRTARGQLLWLAFAAPLQAAH
jgi:sulfate adenylyltransferase subunit 2